MIQDSITFPQYDSPDEKTDDELREERAKNACLDSLFLPIQASIDEKELTALWDAVKQAEIDHQDNGDDDNACFDSLLPQSFKGI